MQLQIKYQKAKIKTTYQNPKKEKVSREDAKSAKVHIRSYGVLFALLAAWREITSVPPDGRPA
jgi:hypothetical protein